jgi:hypothetical protein
MLVDVASMRRVQVAIVQVIGVSVVANRPVPAVDAMRVGVSPVFLAAHLRLLP